MKYMKLSLLFVLFSIVCVSAQSKSVVVTQPGTLGSKFTFEETYSLKNITISGKLNAYDFKFLSSNFSLLETIDLGGCTIYSYSGSDGPTWASTVFYPENELPQNSFSSTHTSSGIKTVYGRKTLKSVVLPAGITSIGADAFNECTALATVKLPATLQLIRDYAFRNCTALTSVQCLAAVPPVCGVDALAGINAGACSVIIPANTTSLYQADTKWKNFKYSTGGYTVGLSNSNEAAGTTGGQEYRFYNSNESVSLKAIPKNSLATVSWTENGNLVSTDSIYSFKISGNRKLTTCFTLAETYNLPGPGKLSGLIKNPKVITHLTLRGNIDARDILYIRDSLKALQSLDLERTFVTSYYGAGPYISAQLYNDNVFPMWAFFTYNIYAGNPFMTTVKLPANIVTIEYNCFNNCRALDSITIPQGVTAFKEYAFGYCTSLKSIKNLALQPAPLTNTVFTDVAVSSCELLVPIGTEQAYKAAPYWSGFNIKTGGYSISAKSNNDLIGSVSGIETRFYAPEETLILKAIPFNSAVFKNWTENGTVISTDSILEIKAAANRQIDAHFGLAATLDLAGGGTLKNVITNPKAITSLTLTGKLDARDFRFIRDSIPSLEILDISGAQISAYTVPNTSTSYKENQLPAHAFSYESYPGAGMKFLKTVLLPKGMTNIGERAFMNCYALGSVWMPLSLKTISPNAFGNCKGLNTINLAGNLSSIGYSAFEGCSNLKTVNNFSLVPISMEVNPFNEVASPACNLKVPNGTLNAYKADAVWKKFNVSEGGYVVSVSSNGLTTGTVSGTENRFYTLDETVSLQCAPMNGTVFSNWTDNGQIVSTDRNFSFRVSTNHHLTANFIKETEIRLDTPGTLKDKMPERISITRLKVSGTIDARDIQFMRDSLPALEDLDLGKSNIVAFMGMATYREARNFAANTLPQCSFFNPWTMQGKESLKNIILPDSLSMIDTESFRACTNLVSVTFPSKLTTIYGAFADCKSLTDMVIPSTVTTLSGSFKGCTKLRSITLPESLTRIDQESFKGCVSLKAVNIPNGVVSISYSAFEGCASLEKIKLPEALTYIYRNAFTGCTSLDSLKLPSKLTTIDDEAFAGCTGLKDIAFGNTTPVLSRNAFANCTGLTKLVFPRRLKSIAEGAFQNCTSLAYIAFPDDLETLGSGAFAGCTSLAEVKVPGKIADLRGVFANCTGLKNVILQTGLKRILDRGFEGCTSLETISIPTGVTYLGSGVFQGCTSLTEVNLPAGLTNIGSSAFDRCTSLKSILLPSGLTKLEGMTFNNCSSLASVTLPVEISSMFMLQFSKCINLTEIVNLNPVPLPASSMTYAFNEMDPSKCRLIVHSSSVNAFKSADVWKKFIIVDGGYSVIASPSNSVIGTVTGGNRFYQPNEVATLQAITRLGSAFVNWTENGAVVSTNPVLTFSVTENRNLKANFTREITVFIPEPGTLRDSVPDPNSVTKLSVKGDIDARDIKFMRDNLPATTYFDLSGSRIVAYTGAEGTLEGNYTYAAGALPNSAFVNRSNVRTIILNNGLTAIENNAFDGCSNLTQCTLPNTIVSIGRNSFGACRALTALTLPPGLQQIGSGAFNSCTGLTTLILPSGLIKMGESAFSFCTGLTRVVFPGSLPEISMMAFSSCTNIRTIEFNEGLTRISYGAFSGCSGVETLAFPASLAFIGTSAFGGCSGLKEVALPAGLTVLAYNSFISCTGLKKIINASAVPLKIESEVFSGVNQPACSLVVPTGSENAYKGAPVWKNFNISGSGYSVSALSSNPLVGRVTGLANKMYAKNESVTLTAEAIDGATFTGWTENGDVVTTNPVYTFTVTANRKLTAGFKREAVIHLSTAGLLKDSLKSTFSITSLRLRGNIDARDIREIRDNYPSLVELDLKESRIQSYTGSEGTYYQSTYYPEREMPPYSLKSFTNAVISSVKSVILPDNLDSIAPEAFFECIQLKSVVLPAGLKSIGRSAFHGCTGLDTITFPAGILSMREGCFNSCDNLERITNLSPQPLLVDKYIFSSATYRKCKLIVPDQSVELYRSAPVWKNFLGISGLSSYQQEEPLQQELLVYPIPAEDIIFIRHADSVSIQSVRIYDINGKLCWISETPVSEINLVRFKKNLYFMQIETVGKTYVRRFIKK